MSDELKQRALALFKPPFKFRSGYILDAEQNMVADQHEGEDLRIRGWGRIQKMPDAAALQDAAGALIAEALTEYWARRTAPSAAPSANLPPLPEPRFSSGTTGALFTADQVRQAQREAYELGSQSQTARIEHLTHERDIARRAAARPTP